MQAQIKEWLEWFWDTIDISEMLKRAYGVLKQMQDDMTFNIFSLVSSLVMALFFFFLAWKFDYESTWNALSITRNFIEEGSKLPETIIGFNIFSLLLLITTLAPTFIELFGATFAKAQIRVVQIAVIGLSIFDAVTDIPTVTVFLMRHGAYFDQLGFLFSTLGYAIAFVVWLFLATFGFELLLCLSGYCAVYFAGRILKGNAGGGFNAQQQRRN